MPMTAGVLVKILLPIVSEKKCEQLMAEEKCEFKTSIGGQALIEGILMRGPDKQAIVCRTPEGIEEKTEDIVPLKENTPFLQSRF